MAYFAAKGLKDCGFAETADKIKETILSRVKKDGDKIHENHNSETGEGSGVEYFSRSAVFVMEFILLLKDCREKKYQNPYAILIFFLE